uniref:Uncharacterized protein n=1 Tax=viral metagenome TaxID=1070528 RepID=A0A6C0JJ82_9ZZZZ
MVKYNELKKGKTYKLGDINIGNFVRWDKENEVLVFTGSQYGEEDEENEIDENSKDDYVEIKTRKPKSKKTKSKKGGRKHNKKTRRNINV